MTGKFLAGFLALAVLLLTGLNAAAQQDLGAEKSNIVKANLSQAEIDKIVAAFSAKEGQYRQALNQYGFRREATIQTIGFGGQVSGEYRRDSQFTFGDDGRRYEKVLFAPLPTIKELQITTEDIEDLGGVNQFALEASKINQYSFTFLGKEKIDELNLYVFDVAPKVMPDPKKIQDRYFQGRIWVDDQDLQIVKSKGKGVPEGKQRFPVVETYRENIDTKYWFPTYSYANQDLVFETGQVVHFKMKLKFSDYKQGRSEVRILDD
ncbi:MAG: hypothetical protein ABI954_12145, partial [Pyrinomonadaceae bacterium]